MKRGNVPRKPSTDEQVLPLTDEQIDAALRVGAERAKARTTARRAERAGMRLPELVEEMFRSRRERATTHNTILD